MRYAAGGGNFTEDRSSWRSNGDIALALCTQLRQPVGVNDADGFAAFAAAEAVKIERNSRGGDSGDERR